MSYRPSTFRIYFDRWVSSLAELVDGVAGVMTLGFWKPGFSFQVVCIQAKRNCYRAMEWQKKNEKEDT